MRQAPSPVQSLATVRLSKNPGHGDYTNQGPLRAAFGGCPLDRVTEKNPLVSLVFLLCIAQLSSHGCHHTRPHVTTITPIVQSRIHRGCG